MTCIYAFCRLSDNVIDEAASQNEAKEKLAFWYQEVNLCYSGNPSHPVVRQLQGISRDFKIPKDYFLELLRGVEMDLFQQRYRTFDDLYQYCYRVASIVGLICIEIFGYQNSIVKEHAINQGLAFQLTNILRDIRIDGKMGRIYVPQENLEKFNYTEEDLLNNTYNVAFQNLMHFEVARAKNYYRKAKDLIPKEDRSSLLASEIMGATYYQLLRKIEKNNYNVFRSPIRLSSHQKAFYALSTWARIKLFPFIK